MAESRIEDGIVVGNVYKNRVLHLTFEFPPHWIAAKPEVLESANERGAAAANANIQQQHPEMTNSPNFAIPKVIFYASKKGSGDGQRIDIPSIRITALPSHNVPLNLENFQRIATQMAAGNSMQIIGTPTPSTFEVDDHAFYRADMEHATGAKYYTFSSCRRWRESICCTSNFLRTQKKN